MNKIQGVFLSDIHLPDSIEMKPVIEYIKDLYKIAKANKDRFYLILGGDIIDAKGLHGIESMQASQIRLEWYDRDVKLLVDFLTEIKKVCTPDKVVFIEGNHEERYRRITLKYPDAFGGRFDFNKDCVKKVFPNAQWVPYATYKSFYVLGDCYFIHGTWPLPEQHAKKIALTHTPYKVVYGHMHTWQVATIHNAIDSISARYAVTAGCLCPLAPEWKKGSPHQWINGFITFTSDGKVTTPTVHIIENNRFTVMGKEYK